MHEEPQVPNYRTGRPGRKLEPGLCLAIEPMFTLGGYDTRIEPDDWTVVTADGSLAAHFEHSIAITEDGPQHPDRRMTRRLPGSAIFDTLRVRVSARSGRHCA